MSRSLLIVTTGALTLGALVAQADAQNRTSRAVAAAQADAARAQASRYGRGAETDRPAEAAQPDTLGRPNPGRPQFQDPEFRGGSQNGGQNSGQNGGRNGSEAGQNTQADGSGQAGGNGEQTDGNTDDNDDDDVIEVAEGFFFDNFTSGSGFGVYGGEAVTSGQERQLNLPSAAVNARNLGLPILPDQPVGTGQPQQPEDPPLDGSPR